MTTAATISQELAQITKTLVLGGVAVIFHGLNRLTKDLDLWIDPNPTTQTWAAPIEAILQAHPEISAIYLDDSTGKWEKIDQDKIALAAENGRVLRLLGGDRPIDIFYQPNEVELDEFDQFWNRAIPLGDGTRVLDLIDLALTKQDTGREHDQTDLSFVEHKIETELCKELPHRPYDYAVAQLERFSTANTAFSATTNPDPKVQELGLAILNRLAQADDPFSKNYLEEIRQKKS